MSNEVPICAQLVEGVHDVIVYPSAGDKHKNRGFAFVEFQTHRAASVARKRLRRGKTQLWGHAIAVDWAEPERQVEDTVMANVRVLYVRNLMLATTEDTIRTAFARAVAKQDPIERVKKIKDFCTLADASSCMLEPSTQYALQAGRAAYSRTAEGTLHHSCLTLGALKSTRTKDAAVTGDRVLVCSACRVCSCSQASCTSRTVRTRWWR